MHDTSTIFLISSFLLFAIAFSLYLKAKSNPIKTIVLDRKLESPTDRHGFRNRYNEYMKSKEWEELKGTALEKFNYTCEICGRTAQAAHHKIYPIDFKEDNLNNLQVLCNRCHFEIHKQQIATKKQEALFTDSVLSGRQHFRIEVREAINKAKYVVITELRADKSGKSDDMKVLIFEENLDLFNQSLNRAAKFIKYKRFQKRA
jgi:hypothetical protein